MLIDVRGGQHERRCQWTLYSWKWCETNANWLVGLALSKRLALIDTCLVPTIHSSMFGKKIPRKLHDQRIILRRKKAFILVKWQFSVYYRSIIFIDTINSPVRLSTSRRRDLRRHFRRSHFRTSCSHWFVGSCLFLSIEYSFGKFPFDILFLVAFNVLESFPSPLHLLQPFIP